MMICQLHEMVKHGAASSIMMTGRVYAIKRTKEALRQRQKQRSGSVTSGNSREKIWILTLRILLKSISLMWRTGLEKAQSKIKDMTDRETYLKQRKTYEQLLVRMQGNIENQEAAVRKMAAVDLPEVAGFEMLEGLMKLQKLNKEIVDAFVAEIVVYDRERIEIKLKFSDEFQDAEKGERAKVVVIDMEIDGRGGIIIMYGKQKT